MPRKDPCTRTKRYYYVQQGRGYHGIFTAWEDAAGFVRHVGSGVIYNVTETWKKARRQVKGASDGQAN
jgi:viroplasmin and RNaseH domain-containing protein